MADIARFLLRDLQSFFTEAGASSVEVVEDVEKAFGRALEVKGDDGMLFCVGSLYLVGEIKDVIRRNKK
ncbi:MAG: hypothetical protein ACLTER_04165 [Ruminococcus sp.]